MLIRIPETPGIPAVLREIAALCPRHSSTAATRLFSFPSPVLLDRPADRPTDRPTDRCACEYARARDTYRGRFVNTVTRISSRTRFPSLRNPPLLQPPLSPISRAPWVAVDFSRWKGRPVMAGDISAILYDVRRVFRRENITTER